MIGFDDIEETGFATPSLTTIAPDKQQMGELAVSFLLGRIEGTRTGPQISIKLRMAEVSRRGEGGWDVVGRAFMVTLSGGQVTRRTLPCFCTLEDVCPILCTDDSVGHAFTSSPGLIPTRGRPSRPSPPLFIHPRPYRR